MVDEPLAIEERPAEATVPASSAPAVLAPAALAPVAPAPGAAEPGRADAARESGGAIPRYSRRLSDKILISFHQACDQSDYDVARRLLDVFEFMLLRREVPADANRRRSLDSLVAAHERLWHLRHPEQR